MEGCLAFDPTIQVLYIFLGAEWTEVKVCGTTSNNFSFIIYKAYMHCSDKSHCAHFYLGVAFVQATPQQRLVFMFLMPLVPKVEQN